MPSLHFGILFFILGAVFGSFTNVCIYRIPIGLSIVSPPSFCPFCKRKIYLRDNIPLLGYLLLRGRCRFCGYKIPFRYFLVELISALLFLSLYQKLGLSWELLFSLIFFQSILIASFIDIDHLIIPDFISLGTFVLFIILSFFRSIGFVGAITGAISGSLLLFVISYFYKVLRKREGLGFGDVKLMLSIGAFSGLKGALFSIFTGSMIGAITGAFLILLKKMKIEDPLPFGPFLSFGILLWSFWGEKFLSF